MSDDVCVTGREQPRAVVCAIGSVGQIQVIFYRLELIATYGHHSVCGRLRVPSRYDQQSTLLQADNVIR